MATAQIVRIIAHKTNVQVLCSDERGLLSVYFDQEPFVSFYNLIKRSGLKLSGLQIEFNHELVRVSALRKTFKTTQNSRKGLKALFSGFSPKSN